MTVRTKARDSQSADSAPTPIPLSVLRGGAVKSRQQPHSAVMPAHIRQQMPRQQQQQQGQQVYIQLKLFKNVDRPISRNFCYVV